MLKKLSATTALLGTILSLTSVAEAAVRIIPNKDRYAKCANTSPTGNKTADTLWCRFGVRVFDNLNVTRSLFDLNQMNLTIGGNKDLVYQVREGKFEVFACPSMQDAAQPAPRGAFGAEMSVAPSTAADPKYWSCKQIYSSPLDVKQICDDYTGQTRARSFLDKAFNQVLGTITIGQIPPLTYGVGLVVMTSLDVIDTASTIRDYIGASCKTHRFDDMLEKSLSANGGIKYVSEPAKFGVLETIAVHATRTDAGRRVDEQTACGNNASYRSPNESELSLGDRSRSVVMSPQSVSGGAIPYTASKLDRSYNPMSLGGQNTAPGACTSTPHFGQ